MTVVEYEPVRSGIAAQERRIKLVPFGEIKLGTERRYIIKGLFPRVGLAIVWGPPKSGKSFWTFDAVMHIALGWKYRGRRVHQGPVIYCAFEGQTGIEARVEAFRQRHLVEEPANIPFFLQPATLNLVADHQELIAVISRHTGKVPPVVVVLDTLNRSLQGSESNDEDMSAYVQAADAIREAFGCAVIIVHHCGVDATRPRGHTSLTGACDAQLSVKREANEIIIVTVDLMKDGAQGDTIASRLEVVDVGVDEDGETISSCVIVEADAPEGKSGLRLTSAAKIAFDLLTQAIIDAGEKPPASDRIQGDKLAVPVSLWRKYCYSGQISEGDTPDANKKAFSRASRTLQSLGKIGVWNEWVWIA